MRGESFGVVGRYWEEYAEVWFKVEEGEGEGYEPPWGTKEYNSFLWYDIMVTSLCGSNEGACELGWGDEFESTLKSFSILSSAF